MVFGKQVRLDRITRNGRMLCIPMDHGLSNGPLAGIEEPWNIISQAARGGATAVLTHKGIIKSLPKVPQTGLILQLSASTTLGLAPNRKIIITSVEEGIRLGVDGISVHINIGSKEEPEMLEQLGTVADACDLYQMPFIAMMYPRGENIKNPADPEVVAHTARIGAEAGADIVKTVYTGDEASFREVVRKCPVPVVLAGGAKTDDDAEVLRLAETAMKAGAMGVTFGRNVFQHRTPTLMVRALKKIIIDRESVEVALEVLKGATTS
jgi:fructose-bisphosphate aldolase/2-amino-3,7-dideoxy-D-threo-hept-6-ulosonate synthase